MYVPLNFSSGTQFDGTIQRVMRRFINVKARSKEFKSKVDARPLLLFPEDETVAGRDLYRQKHSSAINAEATKQREEHGQDSRQHAGHYQRILRERWDALPDKERAGWVEKAEKLNIEHDESWDDPQIYQLVELPVSIFMPSCSQ